MQSIKASKKTKIADETGASVPEMNTAAEPKENPRASRSSKLKKETSEMGPAKHRKSSSAASPIESSPAVKTTIDAPIIDSVGVLKPAEKSEIGSLSAEISPSHEEVAKLAYSYWVSRGYAAGSPESDWLRAEHELKSRR